MTHETNSTASSHEGTILHQATIAIPFHLADPVGVLFFGNVFPLVHSVYEDWARSQPGMWQAWFGGRELGYPIRHCEADYLKFLKVGETYEVRIRCASISESTFVLESEIHGEGVLRARAQTVHTAVDLARLAKGIIAPEMRRFLSPN